MPRSSVFQERVDWAKAAGYQRNHGPIGLLIGLSLRVGGLPTPVQGSVPDHARVDVRGPGREQSDTPSLPIPPPPIYRLLPATWRGGARVGSAHENSWNGSTP